MTRREIALHIEIALLIAGAMYVAWLSPRMPPGPGFGHLTTVRGVICTPSIERLRSQARPSLELREPPFDEPPPAFEPSDYLQKIGPHALLRVPEAAELQPEPPPCGPRCGPPFGWHIRHDLRELGVLLPPGGGK